MTKTLPLWAALLFGVICGAVIGTIVAAFYLTLALKTGFGSFDMLTLWKASAGTRAAHPEAFKVGFGAVGFGAIGLGALALAWTWKKERDDYGSAHWQTKAELKKNDMLQAPGKGFVCGKLGAPTSKAEFISSTTIPHVMMVAPTRSLMRPNIIMLQLWTETQTPLVPEQLSKLDQLFRAFRVSVMQQLSQARGTAVATLSGDGRRR